MQIIPFLNLPAFEEQLTLDNTAYKLFLFWNTRGEYWSLTFKDVEDNILVAGIRIILGAELLQKHPDRGLPPGQLWVLEPRGDFTRLEYNDFVGERQVQLAYLTEAELS